MLGEDENTLKADSKWPWLTPATPRLVVSLWREIRTYLNLNIFIQVQGTQAPSQCALPIEPKSSFPNKDTILLTISTYGRKQQMIKTFFFIPSTPDYKLFQKGWSSFETTAGLLFAFRSVELRTFSSTFVSLLLSEFYLLICLFGCLSFELWALSVP